MNSEVTASKISHDLHGPLINIQGFSGELGHALEEISALIDLHRGGLPAEFREAMTKLIEKDIGPCFTFLHGAVQQLEKRINTFANALGTGSHEN